MFWELVLARMWRQQHFSILLGTILGGNYGNSLDDKSTKQVFDKGHWRETSGRILLWSKQSEIFCLADKFCQESGASFPTPGEVEFRQRGDLGCIPGEWHWQKAQVGSSLCDLVQTQCRWEVAAWKCEIMWMRGRQQGGQPKVSPSEFPGDSWPDKIGDSLKVYQLTQSHTGKVFQKEKDGVILWQWWSVTPFPLGMFSTDSRQFGLDQEPRFVLI